MVPCYVVRMEVGRGLRLVRCSVRERNVQNGSSLEEDIG